MFTSGMPPRNGESGWTVPSKGSNSGAQVHGLPTIQEPLKYVRQAVSSEVKPGCERWSWLMNAMATAVAPSAMSSARTAFTALSAVRTSSRLAR